MKLLLLMLSAGIASGASSYYVDNLRSSNGDGSEGSPWKSFENISWATVAAASAPVTIYLSSRATWDATANHTIGASGTPANPLRVLGDARFNTNSTGTAAWTDETTGSRSIWTNSAGSGGGGFYITNNSSNIVVSGVFVRRSAFGSINIGPTNPTTNVHNITITNSIADTPLANHGIWMGYAEQGVHTIKIVDCVVSNTPSEGIYMGHYNYMSPTITNVIVERCTVIDCGLVGEGDIDLKPGCYGAMAIGNTIKRANDLTSGATVGIACYADACTIAFNRIFRTDKNSGGAWGVGIFVNADGDGAGNGNAITSSLIASNLVASAQSAGIRFAATTTTSGANMSGIQILHNTIANNSGEGLLATTANGKTVTIALMRNNIFSSNTVREISTTSGVTITESDYNLFRGTNSSPFVHAGAAKDFSGWQALGFDANSLTSDPLFTHAGSDDYTLTTSSPARGSGYLGADLGFEPFANMQVNSTGAGGIKARAALNR